MQISPSTLFTFGARVYIASPWFGLQDLGPFDPWATRTGLPSQKSGTNRIWWRTWQMNTAPSRRTRSFAEFLPAECMVPTEMGCDEEHENCDRWPQTSWRGCPRLLRTARGFLRPVQPRHAVPELARAVRARDRSRALRSRSNRGAYRRRRASLGRFCVVHPSRTKWGRETATESSVDVRIAAA